MPPVDANQESSLASASRLGTNQESSLASAPRLGTHQSGHSRHTLTDPSPAAEVQPARTQQLDAARQGTAQQQQQQQGMSLQHHLHHPHVQQVSTPEAMHQGYLTSHHQSQQPSMSRFQTLEQGSAQHALQPPGMPQPSVQQLSMQQPSVQQLSTAPFQTVEQGSAQHPLQQPDMSQRSVQLASMLYLDSLLNPKQDSMRQETVRQVDSRRHDTQQQVTILQDHLADPQPASSQQQPGANWQTDAQQQASRPSSAKPRLAVSLDLSVDGMMHVWCVALTSQACMQFSAEALPGVNVSKC